MDPRMVFRVFSRCYYLLHNKISDSFFKLKKPVFDECQTTTL